MNQCMKKSDYELKVTAALKSLQQGQGVIVTDDDNRENEADIIYCAQYLTEGQMALLIRECSGIVCLCLTEEKVEELGLSMMVQDNRSQFQTAFTVSIEAKEGVTTGVSAKDRLTTVKAALKGRDNIVSPGHVFPLKAKKGGVLERAGHTEASIDLMKLAGLEPYAVLCELTNPDGTMAKGDDITRFALYHDMPVVSVADIKRFRKN
ncbi:3,4-dihydroxy-2-butanone-4-phosphate synthase [Sulfurimonas sp. HSL-1716]|uniref:3,4-dihydroxy-2-butanone-4-phosphate synthase n=1 Tax=Hydrocurvibacter sulfurireducens TaxID=3131937 RepID=UPI0031F8AB3F